MSAQGHYADGIVGDGWQQFSFIWNSGSATTADLSLMDLRATGYGNDFGIDTISLSSFDPALTSISPSNANAAGPQFTLTLNGSHFNRGSTVQWTSGTTTTALKTIFVSTVQLTALVPAALISNVGTATVTVVDAGGSVSNAEPFIINVTTLTLSSANLTKASTGVYTAKVSLQNTGYLTAPNAKITKVTLGTASTSTTLPMSLGSLANGKTVSTSLSFPSTAGSSGTTVTLNVSGTFTGGTFSGSLSLKLP